MREVLFREELFRVVLRALFFVAAPPRLRPLFFAADDLRAPDAALFRLAPLDLRAEDFRAELERLPDFFVRGRDFLDVAMEKAP